MSKKVILVGFGYWGFNYITTIGLLGNLELVGVVDKDASKSLTLPENLQQAFFTDLTEAIQATKPNFVIVATPPISHFEVANEAIRNGVSVLIEKPMTLDPAEADQLLRIAQEAGVTLGTGLNYFFHPSVQLLSNRYQIQNAKPHLIVSERYNLGPMRRDVDLVSDLLPHDLAIASAIYNASPTEVRANIVRVGSLQLHAQVQVKYPDDRALIVSLSWLHPRKTRTIAITSSSELAVFDELADVGRDLVVSSWEERPLSSAMDAISTKTVEFLDSKEYFFLGDYIPIKSQPLVLSIIDFLNNLEKGTTISRSAILGREITHTLAAAAESVRKNESVGVRL